MTMEQVIEKIPTWALCYIINGDTDGITEEEKAMVDEFFNSYRVASMQVQIVSPVIEDGEEAPQPYFTHCPAFGQPCEVEDCDVLYTVSE